MHINKCFYSMHSGALHSHTMHVISSAVKHCNSKLISLLPARNKLQFIKKKPFTPSSLVWLLLLLQAAFVCLLIHGEETVQFMQFVPECSFTKPPLLQESRLTGGGSPNLVVLVEWKVPVERFMGAANCFH